MMDETLHDTPIRVEDNPPRRFWFGLLGAPVAWALQGLSGWFAASLICDAPDGWRIGRQAIAGLRSIEFGIGVTAALIAILALMVSIRAARDSSPIENASSYRFLATTAVFGSAIFLLGILWNALPVLMLAPCETVR
jgi:hypothetical protein